MPTHNGPEFYGQQYVEDVFDSLPEVEMGQDIKRVNLIRLATGKDSSIKLSVKEALGRDGWIFGQVAQAQKGEMVVNQSDDIFEVMEVKKGRIKIRNSETGDPGEILASERTISAQEYSYQISDNARNSKKIRVYDTIYKDRSLDTSEFIDSLVASIPMECMDVFDEIQIHKRAGGQTGESKIEPAMFSGKRVISLYISGENYPLEEIRQTFYHELGHAIVKYLKNGSSHPGKKWKQVMIADGNITSQYAGKKRYSKENHRGQDEDMGEVEDIAEAVKFYFSTDGAHVKSAEPLRSICKNRFAKLDEVMEDLEKRKRAGLAVKLSSRLFEAKSALNK